jgi:hypothetical protein
MAAYAYSYVASTMKHLTGEEDQGAEIARLKAKEEAETATADMEEEQLEYGANAADITADNMAAIVAQQLEYGANAADITADNMAAIVAQQCDQSGVAPRTTTQITQLSPRERASLAYNPENCCARIWMEVMGSKVGLAVQCSRAKKEGGLCSQHAKPDNFLWLGRMDGPMPPLYPEPVMKDPEHKKWKNGDLHYLMQDAEGKPIEMPVEEPKKKKASKSSGEPKKRGRKPGSKNKKKKSSVEEDQAAEIAKLKAMLASALGI